MCKALGHEMCLRRRVRALAFASCRAWPPALTGALSSDLLFRVSIKTNERTNVQLALPLNYKRLGGPRDICITWARAGAGVPVV